MNNQIINDYGKTVTPELYINALQGHQYIPQADQCIDSLVHKTLLSKEAWTTNVLEVGCGQGRILSRIAEKNSATFYGVDISESFIQFANNNSKGRTSYQVVNFAKEEDIIYGWGKTKTPEFDIVFMQGVMHHIHGEDRAKFLKRSFTLLKQDGILVIGDEFIKDYATEEERILNVAKFYLHIIDEARKGGFDELAEEEAKNLIDDCLSGTKYAGYATKETFNSIYECAKETNNSFYESGRRTLEPSSHLVSSDLATILINQIKATIQDLAESNSEENFNRGDYKVSVNVFVEELSLYGFKLKEKYEIGPVKQLGGMGVLTFRKS